MIDVSGSDISIVTARLGESCITCVISESVQKVGLPSSLMGIKRCGRTVHSGFEWTSLVHVQIFSVCKIVISDGIDKSLSVAVGGLVGV